MSDFTAAETRVLAALDEQALVNDVVDLVRVPSVTATAEESALQDRFAARLTKLGLDVDLWQLDLEQLRADPRYPGVEAPREEGYGLVATSGDGVPALILQGHVDVVPTGDLDLWVDREPYSGRIAGDILHGRGACDMKAGVAVNFAVARALVDSGLRFERPWAIHQVVSEEDGGLGAFATMLRGHIGDAAIITEPTSGRVITANAGALTFRLAVTGRAAHGSTRREGVSAYEAFWPIHLALRELETVRNARPDPLFAGNPLPYGISIGRVTAGDWASSVPDLLVAEGRMGVALDEDPIAARAEFERVVAEAGARDPWLRDHPVSVTWPGGQFGPGRLPDGHPLADEINDAIEAVSGRRREYAAAPYGSDLRLYVGIGGIPSLHYGPGDVRFAHAPREQVSISETIEVARALAVFAVRRLGARR